MNITLVFFLGLIIALVGVIPPGLLNMTAAKISLKEGANRGIMFAIGACVIVFLQTYIAALFARYLSLHQDVVAVLQRVAFVLFVLITVYFLLIAKSGPKKEIKPRTKSKKSRFFQGMLLSGLNMFPIPYQAYMTVTLSSLGWLEFESISILSYVAGAATGTFVMLYFYMFFFDKIKDRTFTSQKNMNRIIGSITGLIAIVTLVNIISDI